MLHTHFEQICDAFKDAVCITDNQGIILFLNKHYAELSGLSPELMIGKSVDELLRQDFFDMALNPEIVRHKTPVTKVQNVSNGRQLILDGTPIFDEHGQVALVVTIIRDNTTLLRLSNKVAAQKELLETYKLINQREQQQQSLHYPFVIHSKAMQNLYAELSSIAGTDATVLLLGETGVGKDVVARYIHRESPRKDNPFVKVDCSSIPENLIETELFGYAPGTFSGGNKHGKAGIIETACEGTLFLDEVGELPLNMQSRLLRVLQDKEIVRVGSTTPRRVDVRTIAATSKDLEKEVHKGRFRRDLFYRLKVIVKKIPPLRARKEDILPLARGFMNYYNGKYKRNCYLSADVEQSLLAHNWPGNIRELENLVLALVVTGGKSEIRCSDLPIPRCRVRAPSDRQDYLSLDVKIEGRTYKEVILDIEYALLRGALQRYGSIAGVASNFAVDRSTIYRKVKEMESNSALPDKP